MRHPPLQAPLLWQTYLGFWIAGITAAPWPLPSLCCAVLLFFADARLWRAARTALASLCLLAGFLTGYWQLYGCPWQTLLTTEEQARQTGQPLQWLHESAQPPRVCGIVRDMQGLPDNRLRLLLSDVRPAYADGRGSLTAASDAAAIPPDAANPTVRPLPGKLAWTWEAPAASIALSPPLPGQAVCLTRRPMPAQGFANEGQTDWGLWLAAQGVRWRMWTLGNQGEPRISGQPSLSARWRESLRQDFVHALFPAQKAAQPHVGGPDETIAAGASPPPSHNKPTPYKLSQGKAILLALLFGDRQYLNQQTLNNFASATLVHSLALSGQHLTVAGLVGLLCVLAAARVRPGIYLRRPRAVWALLATLPPALAYLWLGDAPASLLRAAVMLLLLAVYFLRGRPHTTLDVLCAALLCISVVSPLSMLDTGLQLSVLCVAVIGMSLPWLRVLAPEPDTAAQMRQTGGFGRHVNQRLRRGTWVLTRIFLVSLGIQIALLPLNMLLFNNMGHWFWLNVLWLPVADMLVLPASVLGLFLSALGLDLAARAVLDMAALPCQWLTDCLAWLAGANLLLPPALLRPHWTALPAFAALLGALALKAGRADLPRAAQRLLLAGALLLCVGPILRTVERLSDHIRLDVLDVGQSQALLLRLPGHVRLLLDGGGSASPRFDPGQALVAPALTYNDAPHMAAVLNTHPDLDHMGGLLHILRVFRVDHLLDNGREGKGSWGEQWRAARTDHHSRGLVRGDVLILGKPSLGLRLEVLHPPMNEWDAWQGNDASVVARLTQHGRGLALFLGDAERPVLRRLIDNGDDLRAEVVVAPHHGSATGFLPEFYEAVQPGVVVASCGFENRYGYPSQSLRAWCAAASAPLYYTGRDGAVRIIWPSRGDSLGPPAVHSARP
ncbi:ComEC/Rec2 family competence protein [Desulfovibrio sp.]|uniref:ComEC/Rec2 family competence protein n=1 Tax=Desulfovibrio sp. TaxID=885 RepID=UPI0025BB15DE|nr:ComEC/Rec2 family competence protein [Desulfovibrio sp.]